MNENRRLTRPGVVKINLWTVGAPDLLLAKVSHSHHLVQTFQTNLSSISNTNHHLCVSEGGNSLALRPARANSAIWTDDRMYLTYHQKYSPPKINSSEMFKYSVKKKKVLKSRVAHSRFNRHWPNPMWELQYEQNGYKKKNQEGNKKTVWKGDIRMDGMQFSRNSTHPTQSNVKVHSMSTLTGPHDQKIGFKKRPPPLLHFEFWWCRRRRRGGRKSGQNQQHGNLIVYSNNIH